MSKSPILIVSDLTKRFSSGGKQLDVLKGVSFFIEQGQSCAFVGPSGSGKTTLLGLCATLDRSTSGKIILDGIAVDELDEEERAAIRNKLIGFVFQAFRLIPTLTALENIMVPLELRNEDRAEEEARELLLKVGLAPRADHYPLQLSGGEQQRVAIARAFITRPKILFVDEPTGNLDPENNKLVGDLLFDLNKSAGTTLVLVTHNLELAQKTDRIYHLKDGSLV